MIVLFFSIALLVATAQGWILSSLSARTHQVRQLAGGVLILVGLWLLALALWAEGLVKIIVG